MGDQDPLTDLENLVKTHFGDLLASMSVSANGSLFLSIWQQPVESLRLYMKHLALFYIIGSLDDHGRLCLKLITYHGKQLEMLEETEKNRINEKEKIQFIDKLTRMQLCNGIKVPDNELKLDAQTFSFLYMVEQFEENVIIRSRQCRVGVSDKTPVCESCLALNKESEKCSKTDKLSYTDDEQDFGLVDDGVDMSRSFNDLDDDKHFTMKRIKDEEGENEDSISECFEPEVFDSKFCDDDDDLHAYNGEHQVNGFGSIATKSKNSDSNHVDIGSIYPFFCDECKQSFVSIRELQDHIDFKSHKSKLSSKCFLCQQIIHDSLRFHLWETHWKLYPFKCKMCNYCAVRPSQVSSHYRMQHNNNMNSFDDVERVPEVFRTIQSKENEYGLQFQPSLSNSNSSSEPFLLQNESHFDSEYEKYYYMDFRDSKPFYCEECQQTFSSGNNLKAHCMETCHKSEVKATCFICHETLSQADKSLRIHIYSNHLRLKPFQCKLCPFTSYTKYKLEVNHSKSHYDQSSKENNIEYLENVMELVDAFEAKHGLELGIPMVEKLKTGKMFKPSSRKRKMTQHMASTKTNHHKPFMCDECGSSFASLPHLQQHVDDFLHTSKETAVCFECGDVMETRDAFRHHLWSHHDFKPYKCKYCDFVSTKKELVYIQHFVHTHGGVGSELDVEILHNVLLQIDEYEERNNLHLGPPMAGKRKRSKRQGIHHEINSDIESSPSKVVRQYSCSQCMERYHSFKELKQHYQDTGHKAKYSCFLCGETTPKDVYLRNHIISVHLKLKPYKCVHCSFTSYMPDKVYNGHFRNIHGNGEMGTVDDVIVLPDVLEVLEEFERENHKNLNVSMMLPPLESLGNIKAKKTPGRPKKNVEKKDLLAKKVKVEIDDGEIETYSFDNNVESIDIKPLIKAGQIQNERKRSTSKVKYDCEICLLTFTSKDDYAKDQEKHQKQLLNHETAQCPHCAITVEKVNLNHHFITDHPELKAGCCIECLLIIAPRSKMPKHYASVHRPKNDLCPICGKNFRSVKDHMAVKHGDKTKRHICDLCGRKFTHPTLLQGHMQKIHTERKQLPCKFCGQVFKEKMALTFHYWSMHLKVKPYKCKHCHYQGTQPQRIYEHCRTVHKIDGGRNDCEKIESDFQKIREFEIQHGLNRQDVKVAKEYICWLCKKVCQSNLVLLKHELAHLNLSPFECTFCSSKFKEKVALQSHLDKKHGEKVPASAVKGNTGVLALFERVKRIPPNLVEVYQEYKELSPTVVGSSNGQKTVNTLSCRKCVNGSSENIAAFLDHFHNAHGYEFASENDEVMNNADDIDMEEMGEKLRCKCCGFETINSQVLQRHVSEVHRFTPEMYDQYIEPPKMEPAPKLFRPRKYRCRYCLVYTAVKKFTVHRHIRNTHDIQETFEHDVLLISESEHLLNQMGGSQHHNI